MAEAALAPVGIIDIILN